MRKSFSNIFNIYYKKINQNRLENNIYNNNKIKIYFSIKNNKIC